MSKLTNVSKEEKKMLRSVYLRSFTLFASVTPAKMGASGFCYSMLPFIIIFIKMIQKEKRKHLLDICRILIQQYHFPALLWGYVVLWKRKTVRKKTLIQNQ